VLSHQNPHIHRRTKSSPRPRFLQQNAVTRKLRRRRPRQLYAQGPRTLLDQLPQGALRTPPLQPPFASRLDAIVTFC